MMLFAAFLMAADGGGASLPELPSGAQYGILGILVAMLASGYLLVPRYVLDRERDRANRLEDDNRELHSWIQNNGVPAITEATIAVKESTKLVFDLKREKEIEEEIRKRDKRNEGDSS